MSDEQKKFKGTTTVGVICSDGLIFAADKRATMGFFIANKDVEKISQIDDRMAVTIAGSVADAQALVRLIKAEVQLYKMKNGRPISVSAACTLLSNLMFQYKFMPFWVQILIGGYDTEPRIFNLDPVGGVTSEKFVSTGSGSPVAYGLLEDAYRDDKPIKENVKLALRALTVAMRRDAATGEGIDLTSIDKDGVKKYGKEEIKKLIAQGH